METAIPSLPKRPTRSQNVQKLNTTSLATNHYCLSFQQKKIKIFLYHLSFEPEIPQEHHRKISRVVFKNSSSIEKLVGKFIHSGLIIFGSKENDELLSILTETETPDKEANYTIKLQKVKTTVIETLSQSTDKFSNDNPIFQFINVLVKDCMKEIGMNPIGKNNRYYNLKNVDFLENYPIKVLSGFYTASAMYQGGPKLLIDFNTKVLNSRTVLEFINELKEDSNQQAIESEIVDRIVISNYGSNQTYRVVKIDWKKNPKSDSEVKDNQGKIFTYASYMQVKYGIKVKDLTQPLLGVEDPRNKDRIIYLIPELFNLTGISDQMRSDYKVMKELAEYTKLEPQERMGKTSTFSAKMKDKINASPFGIDLEQPKPLEGVLLPPPTLKMKGNMKIQADKPNFFIKESLQTTVDLADWVVIGNFKFKSDNQFVDEFVERFMTLASKFGMNVQDPTIKYVSNPKFAGIKAEVEKAITKNTQLVVTIIPDQLKNGSFYKDFKQYILIEKGINSQFVTTKVLKDQKKVGAVMAKILVQINAKCGAIPWLVQQPANLPPQTMLIGADVYHKLVAGRKSLLGFCASLNQDFTSYFGEIAVKPAGKELMEEISGLIQKALIAYRNNNKQKSLPLNIIFYRDGVGESQVNLVRGIELQLILNTLQEVYSSANKPMPGFAHIIVTKRINDRFFLKNGNQYKNPLSGTIVSSEIVSNNFDFFMASQNVTQGTCTPTHYNVIYNTIEAPEDFFWELTYYQTFSYFNWTGPIKVPTPVMLAHKIAFMIGDTFQSGVHERLKTSLYYL